MRTTAHRPVAIAARVAVCVAAAVGLFLSPATAQPPMVSQCGGTPDCPLDLSPPPGLLTPVSTETDPGGNYLVAQNPFPPPPVLCFEASGPIAGAGLIAVGNVSETQLFTQAPSIDVVSAGRVLPFPLTGDTLQCGAVVCLPGIGEAVAVTDQAIGTVFGSQLREHALAAGAAPVSAAGIGTCLDGSNTFTLCVETTAPGIQCAFHGESFVFPMPAPLVATPESFTNGQFSGVVAFTDGAAHVISGGTVTTQPFGGTYVSHFPLAGGLLVTFLDAVTMAAQTALVPLPAGADIVTFGACGAPLDSCPTPSGSQVAINLGPCDDMDAATATWPLEGVQCESLSILSAGGGPTSCPPPPPIGAKTATVWAYADTTLDGMGPDVDGGGPPRKIWNAGSPGTPATVDGCISAFALSVQDGAWDEDLAWAYAEVCAEYDPDTCRLQVTHDTDRRTRVVHDERHRSLAGTWTDDPVVYEAWPSGEDLAADLRLPAGLALPLPNQPGRPAQGRVRFEIGSNLPGFANLWTVGIDARWDGAASGLEVDFSSNPALGLDDDAVAAALSAALVYDPLQQAFTVASPVQPVSVALEVPAGTERVILTQTHAASTEVLEPDAAPDFLGWCGDGIVEPALGEECEPPGVGLCNDSCRPLSSPPSDWRFDGVGEGGEIRFFLRDVEFVVPTAAGESAADVARRIASEVAAHPLLAGEVDTLVLGGRILLGERVRQGVVDDPGLAHLAIPTLDPLGLLALAVALLAAGWWLQRRRRSRLSRR